MKLESFMLAEAASALDGKFYVHGGAITRIVAPLLPWTHPQLALVAQLLLEEGDADRQHEVGIAVRDPDGAFVVPRATLGVQPGVGVQPRSQPLPDEPSYVVLALTISPLMVGRYGLHTVTLDVNGEALRHARLVVVSPEDALASAPQHVSTLGDRAAAAGTNPGTDPSEPQSA